MSSLNRYQRAVIEYLQEENQVLPNGFRDAFAPAQGEVRAR